MKPTSNESDSDDISLISEDEDSEALKGSSTGPKTWSEVDESKLRTLSSRLSQLILGSKSSQTLPSITSSSEIKSIGQQGDLHTTSKYGVEEGLSNSDLDKAKFLNKLASLYQGVSWDDLVQDFELLRSDFTESADQMKSLIKEHFQHFIVIQDATNDILTRMTALEMEVDELGVHGATATDVQESITRSIQLSKDVFDSMLQRNERKQNISRMLNALGQYDALVTLASQIRESAESEDFEMVIQLYRKAGSFVDGARSVEDPSAKQMWDKLRMEVNTAMVQAIDVLTSRIEDGDAEPSEAAEAVATLKRLEDEGVPAAMGIDGVSMLLRTQTRSISEKITAIKNNIIETLKVAEKDSTDESGASNTEFILGNSSLFSDNIQDGSLMLVLTVTGWMAELCKIMMRPSTDSSINWKHHEEKFKRALFTVVDAFETEAMGIQSHLIKSSDWIVVVTNGNTVGLFQALAQGHQLLMREEMPSFMVNRFSDVVSKLARAVWNKVDTSLCFAARLAAISQSWTASPGCMSKAAAQLRLILVHGLDFILTLQAECMFAVLETSEPTSSPMQILCNAVCCFTDGIVEFAKQEIDLDSSSRQTVRQLLHGWQVLETLISVIVPFIADEPDFLKSTSDVSEANELLSGCHEHVKASALGLIGMYLDQKLKEIDKIMENLISNSLAELGAGSRGNMQDVQPLIQSWGLNCLPACANPSVWNLLTSINSVGSEISAIAEPLHTDVLSELLDRIGKGFEELMKSQVLDSMSSLSLQQLWLDLTIFVETLSNMEAKGVSLMSLQTFLSKLEATVIQSIQSSESNTNSGQWNQSSGDVRRWIERQCISEVKTAKLLTR